MSLSQEMLESLDSHWAVAAVGAEELRRAERVVNQRLAEHAVGEQIAFDFRNHDDDLELLDRVAFAYELAAVEGLDDLSHPEGGDEALHNRAVAASFKAFDLRRLLPVPDTTSERLYHVLHLSALAYTGDRWPDLRRWYREHPRELAVPSVVGVSWDNRLMYRLFHCWVRLFRKDGWDDLDRIRETIAGLRDDQKTMEAELLARSSEEMGRAVAFRLMALYNWAKATEVLAHYMLQGDPGQPFGQLDKHYEAAVEAAARSGDARHEMILRWLHATSRAMITSSLWWALRGSNSKTSDFVAALTSRQARPMFELLPPQRAALTEQGLLDQAKTAVVIDLPTSGGKTLLAQFRILQALNQFDADDGWVAYVAPTRALTAQVTRTLRQDFEPAGIRVEQLTAAVEIDAFEEEMLTDAERSFDVLVATPEKLSLVIRNQRVERPLALIVMDEAHNIEDTERGMRIELLLATVKRDCPKANFLLLMPYVESSESIARWLAHDVNAGRSISLGTSPWKPNERIVGLYSAAVDDSVRAGWRLVFETLTTTGKAMPLQGTHKVGGVKPLEVPKSKVLTGAGQQQQGLGLQTAAIGAVMSARGTSIAVANNIRTVWTMAEKASEVLPRRENDSSGIRLVQDFLRAEIHPEFKLVGMLDSGVGVHHAGLSDEIRALMEWLAESGQLRLLCATSTIAQGINFPVASVFLASRFVPGRGRSSPMSSREFWNLAGRAGRIAHDSVGVVGLAQGNDREAAIEFIGRSTGALASRLVTLLEELAEQGRLSELAKVLWQDQWEDFRCYIAHLWAEKQNLQAVLADSEQLLRQTYGYTTLRNDPEQRDKAEALLQAAHSYAHDLAVMNPGVISLADSTGFSPEGVKRAMGELNRLEHRLRPADWAPESLFGEGGRMDDLFGVMLKVPQLKRQLDEIASKGSDYSRIADVTRDWVNGRNIMDIANNYFNEQNDSLTVACRAVYRAIANSGTWGLAALSHMNGSGLDAIPEAERRRIDAIPAMVYHGVNTEEAVLMRMNSAPRSIAERLGRIYSDTADGHENRHSVGRAREFLKELPTPEWERARPPDSALSGPGYQKIWRVLSGETG